MNDDERFIKLRELARQGGRKGGIKTKDRFEAIREPITALSELAGESGMEITYEALHEFVSNGVDEKDIDGSVLEAVDKLKDNVSLLKLLAAKAVKFGVATKEQRELHQVNLENLQTGREKVKDRFEAIRKPITAFAELSAESGAEITYEALHEFVSNGVDEKDIDGSVLEAVDKLKDNVSLLSLLAGTAVKFGVATKEQRELHQENLENLQTGRAIRDENRAKNKANNTEALRRMVKEEVLTRDGDNIFYNGKLLTRNLAKEKISFVNNQTWVDIKQRIWTMLGGTGAVPNKRGAWYGNKNRNKNKKQRS